MKTTNKLPVMTAVALAMSVIPNVKADGALLSPRAQGNQIVHMTSDTNLAPVTMATIVPNPGALLTPRAQGNQIVKAAGIRNDPDLVAALQGQSGTPRTKSLQSMPVYQIAPMK
jgi:hypothetical protein